MPLIKDDPKHYAYPIKDPDDPKKAAGEVWREDNTIKKKGKIRGFSIGLMPENGVESETIWESSRHNKGK